MTGFSKFSFLRCVRIHDGECGAVARALHHEAKRLSLPAVFENVSNTTKERKQMSKKTYFKRISLAVVVALGFGVLSGTTAANAGISSTSMSLTLSSSSASVSAGETATTALTATFNTTEATDSVVIESVCTLSTGETCSNNATAVSLTTAKPVFYFGAFPDSNTGTVVKDAAGNTVAQNDEVDLRITNSASASTTRLVFNAKAGVAVGGKKGVYSYVFTMTPYSSGTAVPSSAVSVTWSVTVGSANSTIAGVVTYLATTAAQAKYYKEFADGILQSAKDSAVTKATVASDASSPVASAYVYACG